jgi:hypothetical protein
MKTILLSAIALFNAFANNAQIIEVSLASSRKFSHGVGISTREAMYIDSISYSNSLRNDNVAVFDLNEKKFTLNNYPPCEIIQVNINANVLDCVILDNGVNVHFKLGKNERGIMQFLSEWEWEGKVNGYFTLNSDVKYSIHNDQTQIATVGN